MSLQFEPFQDRLSRDIRNDLAAAMGAMLEQQDIGPVQKVADRYLDRALAPWYREYIVDRLQRYRSVLEVLRHRTGRQLLAGTGALGPAALFRSP